MITVQQLIDSPPLAADAGLGVIAIGFACLGACQILIGNKREAAIAGLFLSGAVLWLGQPTLAVALGRMVKAVFLEYGLPVAGWFAAFALVGIVAWGYGASRAGRTGADTDIREESGVKLTTPNPAAIEHQSPARVVWRAARAITRGE